MGKRTSFFEPAHRVIWAQALQTCGSQKSVAPSSCRSSSCLPSITQRPEMPASPQRVPVVLQSVAQRSPCGSAARGGGRSAESPGDSRPCHFLCAPRSRAWLRAGARLWRGQRRRPGKSPRAFMWAGGSRHARPAHAHSLPEASRQLDPLRR